MGDQVGVQVGLEKLKTFEEQLGVSKQNGLEPQQIASTTIKFIDMFKDINEIEASSYTSRKYSLCGNIILMITYKNIDDGICVYKIMNHLLKLNMDTSIMFVDKDGVKFGIEFLSKNWDLEISKNYKIAMYMVHNFTVIQNVRKIINNYDMLLFDITSNLQFIKQMLLISKSKHKNVPKFIITHKILYYYLLDKNIMYNQVEVQYR